MPRAALLDVDGTLLDSNDAHASAWVDVLREEGIEVEQARVRRMIGMGGDKVLPELTGIEKESPRGERISERRSAIFRERYLPTLGPFPGARALLERLRAEGWTLTIATSAAEDELQGLLERAGVADLVRRRTTSDDAENSKPDPDIVEAALERAGATAAEAIMLGDPPYDVEAALRAGVRVIALRSGGWDDASLRGAIAIYDDTADLLTRFDRSPYAAADRSGAQGVQR